ncbi:hypothetical protein FPANT_3326 [Fusarium pseudoanthophilum]|uniref:Apple domain-containing protein n=1 Tax=Fusarium pseudoanthophilum TaxID=48495 RepID=A0A8H5UUB0_9HYPO|nr:hypothetical protein FPANT_3326 [Fusarium pseudoanthophilum]
MVKYKRIVATLAYLTIIGVSASPCKPHTTTGTTEEVASLASPPTVSGSSTILPSVSKAGLSSTVEKITTAVSITSSAAADIPYAHEIYCGNALSRGYTTTQATSEDWENCVDDENCNSWFYFTAGACNLYAGTLSQFSAPSSEEALLIGSRNCSP